MYMNAITVNYAEVGDDHLPKSFGLVRNSDLAGQTVYNSKITEINNTYSILQSRDIGTKDIIVSSNTKSDRPLSNFTSGSTSWINHRIPDSDSTAYIFYKDDGYYYKMVEDENGRPVQAKYAPYAHLTNVKDNAGVQPYCEAEIETPVVLQVSAGSVKVVIDNTPVEIAPVSSSLSLQLENANDDNFTSQSVTDSEYTIGSDFNLENTEWTRDGKSVPSWLSGNKIVKSSKTVVGNVHYVKVLTGNNTVKIFRKRSDITAKFNFTNPEIQFFEDGGASSNGAEDSYMSNNSLIIPRVKHGRPQINLLDFFNNAQASWFKPFATLNGPISKQTIFNIDVEIPTPTDTLIFTGWLDGHLVQNKSIDITHKRLPQTITVSGINTNELKSITTKSDLLVHAGGNKFTRSGDFSSQTFTATAHYNAIPCTVDGENNKGALDQVVTFKSKDYVFDDNMKKLVQDLTGRNDIVSLKGGKTVSYPDPSQPVDVTVTVNFSATEPDDTEILFTAEIKLTVQNFNIIKDSVDSITENGSSIKDGTILTYEKNCIANEDRTGFTCTVTVTQLTKSDGTSYTFSNSSGSQDGTIKESTKQLFN